MLMHTAADKTTMVELRRAAMDLLARREHSRAELLEKLRRKFGVEGGAATQWLPAVLDQLAQDGLLSDERYVEAYVRHRRSRGFGPLLIRQELRSKGIDSQLMETVLAPRSELWLEVLRELINRKRGHSDISGAVVLNTVSTPQEIRRSRQKLYRFCLSRGFQSEQIELVLRNHS
jgi:regulatory protein